MGAEAGTNEQSEGEQDKSGEFYFCGSFLAIECVQDQ